MSQGFGRDHDFGPNVSFAGRIPHVVPKSLRRLPVMVDQQHCGVNSEIFIGYEMDLPPTKSCSKAPFQRNTMEASLSRTFEGGSGVEDSDTVM